MMIVFLICIMCVVLYFMYRYTSNSKEYNTMVMKYNEKIPEREKSALASFGYSLVSKIDECAHTKIRPSHFDTKSQFITTLINCKHHEYYDLVTQEIYHLNLPVRSVIITIMSYMKKYSNTIYYNHDNLFFVVDNKIILGIINYPQQSDHYPQLKQFIDNNNQSSLVRKSTNDIIITECKYQNDYTARLIYIDDEIYFLSKMVKHGIDIIYSKTNVKSANKN